LFCFLASVVVSRHRGLQGARVQARLGRQTVGQTGKPTARIQRNAILARNNNNSKINNASMQFYFMTTLLMEWQVILANFVLFVIDVIFETPRDHMLPRVKNNSHNNNHHHNDNSSNNNTNKSKNF